MFLPLKGVILDIKPQVNLEACEVLIKVQRFSTL